MRFCRNKSFPLLVLLLCVLLLSSACSLNPQSAVNTSLVPKNPTAAGIVKNTPPANPCIKSTPVASPNPPDNPIQITVNAHCPIGVSNYHAGLTLNDNSLLTTADDGNPDAIGRVKNLITGTIPYENTHIMGWGAPDPWPDPTSAEPTNWGTLDSRVQHAVRVGAIPVISLDEAPWWMKGTLEGHGATHALTADEEWTTASYESRILDNKMDAWLHLVQRIAERYMAPPYNVRYFQVWNEMKGYYNPGINNFDFTTNPGDPSGPNARHGYTYMYNQVYQRLMATAQALHVPTDAIKVGGPYVFMDVYSSGKQSDPSDQKKNYGTFDQRPLDVIQYWLQHKTGAGFITFDGSNENRDGKLLADPFTAANVFADTVKWIRALDPTLYPGSTTLPIWLAEWFASPSSAGANEDFDNAVKSYAMSEFIQSGGSVALSWGGSGDNYTDFGYWTPTTLAGGGQTHPWYFSMKTLNTEFKQGKMLYSTTIARPEQVAALATPTKIMLINKTANPLSLSVDGQPQTLTPYQVTVVNYTKLP